MRGVMRGVMDDVMIRDVSYLCRRRVWVSLYG